MSLGNLSIRSSPGNSPYRAKCWQDRSWAPTHCRAWRHNGQVITMAFIRPLLCFFWSTSGSLTKLTSTSMPMPMSGTGAFPLISQAESSVQSEQAPFLVSEAQSRVIYFWGEGNVPGQDREDSHQGLRSPGHIPPLSWSLCQTAGHSLNLSLGPKERIQHLCCGKTKPGGTC